MPRQSRTAWLQQQIAKQREWIDKCGGSLAGYIARYGDPGIPPLDTNDQPKIITIPEDQLHLLQGTKLEPVPGTTNQFYAPHSGDGGTAIYQADSERLQSWVREYKRAR